MADIQIIAEVVGTEGVNSLIKSTKALENRVKTLSKAYRSGKVGPEQFNEGLRELRKSAQSLYPSHQKASAVVSKLSKDYLKAAKAQDAYSAAQRQEQQAIKAYTQARREATEANQRFDAQQAQIAKAAREAAEATRRQAKEIDRLKGKYVENYGASQRYKQEIRDLLRAKRQGIITTDQYGDSIQRLKSDFRDLQNGVVKGSNQFASYNTSIYNANQRTKRFASVGLQQAGYQVGDFAVQLQGGTNAAVAFGQQGSQLLGIFGAFGAVLGAALAITTAIVAPMLDSADAGGKMAEEFKNLKAQLDPIAPLMDSIASAANFLKEAAFDSINVVLNNLDRLLVIGSTVAAFFVGKWVAAFVAARVATMSLLGAVNLLKTAFLRFLPTAVVIAVGELVFQFTKLVSAMGGVGETFTVLGKIIKDVFSKDSIKSIFGFLGSKFSQIVAGMVLDAAINVKYLVKTFGSGFNKIGATATGLVEGIKNVFSNLPSIIGDAAKRGANLAIEAFERMANSALIPINYMIKGINALGGNKEELSVSNISDALKFGVSESGVTLGEAFTEGFNKGFDSSLIQKPVLDAINKIIIEADKVESAARRISNEFAGQFKGSNEELIKLIKRMRELDAEGKRINIRKWFGGSSGEDEEGSGGGGSEGGLGTLDDELTAAQKRVQSLADTMKTSMSDAFMSMVEGTVSFKDAMRDMARAVIKKLFDILVVQRLVGSFDAQSRTGSGIVGSIMGLFANANGNAFNNGKVTAFADGGVVSKPTMFPMANGMGLMGEAGPEAVMPLKRGKGGKLGVSAEGGSSGNGPVTVNNHFHIAANGDDSVKRIIQQEAPKISAMTEKQIINSRRRGGSLKQAFG